LAVVLCAGLAYFLILPDGLIESYLVHGRITDEDIGKIQPGMNRLEVESILGRPPDGEWAEGMSTWREPSFGVRVEFVEHRVKTCFKDPTASRPPAPSLLERIGEWLGL